MAAPTPAVRTTPTGYKMPDGWQTFLAFSLAPGAALWEKEVKPISYDGGEAIKTTSMHNAQVHTKAPRSLIDFEDATMECFYDPDVRSTLLSLLNAKTGSITERYPDSSSLDYWGYMRKIEFAPLKEGEPPMCTVTIVSTNWDPTNKVEAIPVFHPSAGT